MERGRAAGSERPLPVQFEGKSESRDEGGQMDIKCCHPDCDAPFDYREGRLVRVSKNPSKDNPSETQHLIEHFWLCGKCSIYFVLEHKSGNGVTVKSRGYERDHAGLQGHAVSGDVGHQAVEPVLSEPSARQPG